MFSKILIANRGEIAVRVIRACRELGIASVAVYSELDRNALHVRLADEAYALGGETAADSYLNTSAILDAIEQSGAEAVHPGYGFYSENADFARAITDRGVTFIGPPPAAIEVMGDKISARLAAEKVGVSGVPGTTEIIQDPDEVRSFGEEHGYPVAIKAAYGGGGRGMKVVHSADEVDAALESAQREAESFFGRSECYMERYLTWPRHIEMQIIADQHGNTVWLGERDCSAQRRHQKLVEESPAPNFPDEVRQAMGEAAVAVAKGCDYTNAGTVEFLFQDGEFYYLEMNTRLQVEHPVSELVSGVDLVREQIRVAAGEALSFSQNDVEQRGHAIEVRINAEDPAGGRFLPSPGTLSELRVPDGFGVRWDGGYEAGDTVSQFYDNLVGKLIVWGSDRDTAISRMRSALTELEVGGIATTASAHSAILASPDFQAGEHSTKWVEETLDLSDVSGSPKDATEVVGEEPLTRKDVVLEVNGKRFEVAAWVPETAGAVATPKSNKPRRSASNAGSSAGSGQVAVPMQGTIVKVLVEVGQEVAEGEAVVVLEAMKMENNINADKSGTITELKVSPGDTVGAGDVVVIIE
ncbi:MAG: carbamoyl phosphate synthase [Acidimicrobiaceae bacterium]|nr:carbamoyl phosphate synthase [Acidimicrobiaceae bacterium]MEC7427666.1 acetyl-CoA carboxylase biotin carboxylase subunit [Actinomycetota bacterium]MEC9088297.1 acetyl-CoA carboxylase biotin carboxylase subunit [Actinomycetota bacterium]